MNENPHKPAADPVFVSTHWTEFSPDGWMILTHSSDNSGFAKRMPARGAGCPEGND